MFRPIVPLILLVSCASFILAKHGTTGNIDKFYKTNIEREAEESDTEQVKTVVRPDHNTPAAKSYISRAFGNRKINPKGVVVDEEVSKSESRRQEDIHNMENLHEPHVHESEPDEPAIVVTEIITRQSDYTTERPVTSRSNHGPKWSYSSLQSYPTYPQRSSSRSMEKSSERHRSSASSSSSDDAKDEEAQPSIPEPTNPESQLKVKEGQAAARQYFYNSRWVPKSYSPPMQPSQRSQQYGNSGYGQETQQYNKVAERDNEMLLVFAHSSKSMRALS